MKIVFISKLSILYTIKIIEEKRVLLPKYFFDGTKKLEITFTEEYLIRAFVLVKYE